MPSASSNLRTNSVTTSLSTLVQSPRAPSALKTNAGATTTHFYRATDGSRGQATNVTSVPAGGVVERRATS